MWRINFCWICQHDPFSSCWPCPSQCLLAYELNATFAVPLVRAPSVFLTAAACVNLGLQPIKQMLPVLLPFPPFMSSCPFLFFFFPRSDAAVPRPSQSCVVQPAAWLLLSSIHAVWVGAWRSCIHCQEQLGPPSRSWELVKLRSPCLWKGLPAT